MRRFLYITIAIVTALAVAAGGAVWYASRLDLDRFRGSIEQQLSKLLDREVRIGQIARVSPGFLQPRLRVQQIDVLGDPVSRSPLAHIDEMTIGLDLRALLNRTVRIARIDLRGVGLILGSDAEGKPMWPVQLSHQAPGDGAGVHVELEQLGFDDANVAYHDGMRGNVWRGFVDDLEIVVHPSGGIDLDLRGEIERTPVRLGGRIMASGAAKRQQVTFEGRAGDVELRGGGIVANVLELTGLDLKVEGRAPRLPIFDAWSRQLQLEPLKVSARLIENEGTLAVQDLELALGGSTQRLRLAGRLDDLAGERRGHFDATLELESLRSLPLLFDLDLPEIGPIRGSMQLRTAGDRLYLEDIDLAAGTGGKVSAHMKGKISDLMGLVAVDLSTRVEAHDLSGLFPAVDPRVRDLGPLKLQARVVGAGRAIHLREIDAKIGRKDDVWASARGEVELIGVAHDVDLEVRGGVTATRRLVVWLGGELPELGPLQGSARLRGTTRRLVVEEAELRMGRDASTRLALAGRALHLPLGETFEFDVELLGPDLRVFEPLFEGSIRPKGPVRAKGTLRVTPEHVSLHDLVASFGRTTLAGAISANTAAAGRRQLTVSLTSPELHLDDLFPRSPAEVAA